MCVAFFRVPAYSLTGINRPFKTDPATQQLRMALIMQALLTLVAFSVITSPADLMLEQHCPPNPPFPAHSFYTE